MVFIGSVSRDLAEVSIIFAIADNARNKRSWH